MGTMSWLGRLGRNLTGRHDAVLVGHLGDHVEAATAAVELARQVFRGELDADEAHDRMVEVEHRGDDARNDLIEELSRALAPPIDREDLYRLSRSVDDVVDNLRDLVREANLYEIEREPLLDTLLSAVADGLASLREGVGDLVDEPSESRMGALQAKKNDIRSAWQEAMAELLAGDDPVTATTLRRRELLRRVDVVGLRLGEAADALADGTVKRTH